MQDIAQHDNYFQHEITARAREYSLDFRSKILENLNDQSINRSLPKVDAPKEGNCPSIKNKTLLESRVLTPSPEYFFNSGQHHDSDEAKA